MRLGLLAIPAGIVFVSLPARAQPDASPMAVAEAELETAEKELGAGPCTSMCNALQSMMRAADRICELAKDGSESDKKRCADARAKVKEAIERVRAACPECNTSTPYAPATKPLDKDAPPPAAAPMKESLDAGADTEIAYRTSGERRRLITVTLDPVALFAPPWIVQPRIERAFGAKLSMALTAGVGSLKTAAPGGVTGRASVTIVGGEVRRYLHGSFDDFGLFVGADLAFRTARMEPGERVASRGFVLGLTLGPVIGVKLVTKAGLTIESRFGLGFVIDDRRPEDTPRDRVVPIGNVGLGWTF